MAKGLIFYVLAASVLGVIDADDRIFDSGFMEIMHNVDTNLGAFPAEEKGSTQVGQPIQTVTAKKEDDDGYGGYRDDGDYQYLRWLWWPVVIYLFWAQSLVCDEYFVPSVQVMSETFGIPDDVAGATVMALGCNGPELFVNVIALFITHSAIGVGTIVGSDVFNLLLICSFSVLCAPKTPLELDMSRLTRDLTFYAFSIGLLYWVIHDGWVEWLEALCLSLCVVVFGVTVALWSRMGKAAQRQVANIVGVEVDQNMTVEDFREKLKGGVSVEVRQGGNVGGRMRGVSRSFVIRRAVVNNNGNLCLSLKPAQQMNKHASRELRRRDTAPPTMAGFNAPNSALLAAGQETSFEAGEEDPTHDVAACLAVGDYLGRLTVTPKNMVEITKSGAAQKSFVLTCLEYEHQRHAIFGGERLGEYIKKEWVFRVGSKQERDMWVQVLTTISETPISAPTETDIAELVQEHREIVEGQKRKSCRGRVDSILDWFCFPVVFSLELLVPECSHGKARKRWPLTFVMAMTFLAIFSWALCVVADKISVAFKINDALLGLTLTAAGTSFPNLVASVLVAKKGQSSMAIANAIGSNIQNVFLALGWPWLAKALCSPGYRFQQDTTGINSGILWMGGTLLMFIAIAAIGKCKLQRPGAILMILTYVAFLVYCFLTAS